MRDLEWQRRFLTKQPISSVSFSLYQARSITETINRKRRMSSGPRLEYAGLKNRGIHRRIHRNGFSKTDPSKRLLQNRSSINTQAGLDAGRFTDNPPPRTIASGRSPVISGSGPECRFISDDDRLMSFHFKLDLQKFTSGRF